MTKGPDKLFKIEQSSRYRVFEITIVNGIKLDRTKIVIPV